MLVVTRRKGQRIVIGDDIEIVVAGISGSSVRLAVVAPRTVTVLRGEVYEAGRKESVLMAGGNERPNFDSVEDVLVNIETDPEKSGEAFNKPAHRTARSPSEK